MRLHMRALDITSVENDDGPFAVHSFNAGALK